MTQPPDLMTRLMAIARISVLAEFASGIAHELNQPLGAITTYAKAGERMLDRPSPLVSATIDVLRHISNEALSAGEGIRRIRRLFAQDESARTLCQMPELIEELKPMLEMYAQEVRGHLHVNAAAALPPVDADRLRIQHVVLALVQNACDASAQSKETPHITIAMTSDRYSVETSVSDSGIGVSEGCSDQLFRAFFTTKRSGTGLGLASSKAIIEAHEGTIGFSSLPSGGARFWFRLPVADQEG